MAFLLSSDPWADDEALRRALAQSDPIQIQGIPHHEPVANSGLIQALETPSISSAQLYTPAIPSDVPSSTSGLGLAPDQPGPIHQEDPTWVRALRGIGGALEAANAGFHGRTPLFMQQQMIDQRGEELKYAHADRLAQLRQTAAHQLASLQEQKRQHDLQLFEKTLTNPRATIMLEELGKTPGFAFSQQASMLSKALKDSDMSSMKAYQEFIPDDVQQKFMKGELPYTELTAWLDEARMNAKESAKVTAKDTVYQRAMKKPEGERSPYERQVIEERQTAGDIKKAEEAVKWSQVYKNYAEGDKAGLGTPDHSVPNRLAQSMYGSPFDALPPGGKEQQAVMNRYSQLYPQGRTDVQMTTPMPTKERVNYIKRSDFVKSGSLVQPPPGATEGQVRSGDYIEMTDKQKDAWGEVVNSGVTMNALFDLVDPLITATTPGQAAKQYARLSVGAFSKKIPAATTYAADREAFASRLSRVFGSEVGVLTQGDIDRWMRALPTFGDTVDVAKQKKKIFTDIYNQARTMTIKKIAGDDISQDLQSFRTGLTQAEKVNPPSLEEDLQTLMGGKK